MKLLLLLVLGLGFSLSVQAEYRAFWIEIASPDGSQKKMVKSNLDPLQYVGYHTIPEGHSVLYTETWMCKGRTNGQTICPSPKELESQRQPANTETP